MFKKSSNIQQTLSSSPRTTAWPTQVVYAFNLSHTYINKKCNCKQKPLKEWKSKWTYHPCCRSSLAIWKSKYTYVPCSYSSVATFGSSCLWNHVLYFLWYLHDCFFNSFAAKYCWYVFCRPFIDLRQSSHITRSILHKRKMVQYSLYLLIVKCKEQGVSDINVKT